MPQGVNQCWCDPAIVHLREYRNWKSEYEAQAPGGVAEILRCGGIGSGFKVSLPDRESGKGDHSLNPIAILAAIEPGRPFQR
jgi:hypothetical protein